MFYGSSVFAVAMEKLNLLNEQEKEYAQSRDGLLFTGMLNGEPVSLSFREVLDALDAWHKLNTVSSNTVSYK